MLNSLDFHDVVSLSIMKKVPGDRSWVDLSIVDKKGETFTITLWMPEDSESIKFFIGEQ